MSNDTALNRYLMCCSDVEWRQSKASLNYNSERLACFLF